MNEYELLKTLLDRKQVKLGIAIRPMNQAGSPVFNAWETLLPPAAVLGASMFATWAVHYYLGMAVLAAGCAWWLGFVQPKIVEGVYQRTLVLVMNDPQAFDGLWRKGVLSLIHTAPDGSQTVAHRRDDWRQFVRLVSGQA